LGDKLILDLYGWFEEAAKEPKAILGLLRYGVEYNGRTFLVVIYTIIGSDQHRVSRRLEQVASRPSCSRVNTRKS